MHAGRTAQRGNAQAGIFGQRQQLARRTVRLGFEDRVLGERRAGLVDVEVDADVGQTEQVQG